MINASLSIHLARVPSTLSLGLGNETRHVVLSPANSIFHSWANSAVSNRTGLRGQPVYTLAKFKAGFMNLEWDFHAVYTTVKLSADSI